MFNRTFGWVQNPSDFNKLKRTVQIFDPNSTHYHNLRNKFIQEQIVYFDDIRENLQKKLDNDIDTFSYAELVGNSRDKHGNSAKTRAQAEANALIQISWLPQQWKKTGKHYTDNWTSDGFLRWAVSLNFVRHDRTSDMFTITDLGKEFSQTEDESDDEKELLTRALLSYPPATQVLKVLSENPGYKTKFFIGEQLGFRGEKGFSSYDETLMVNWLKSARKEERSKIRSDVEGTSDKYARMISTWLKKLGLVTSHSEEIYKGTDKFSSFVGYGITAKGKHAIQQAHGSSKNTRVVKYLEWEFLATDGKNRDYVRTRRAYILKFLQETKSFSVLLIKMNQIGFNDDERIINNDIVGLNTFGIRIVQEGNTVDLKDLINDFTIPNLKVTTALKDEEGEKHKADFMRRTNLAPKYIELLDIAYDGNRNRDFEMVTAELFRKVYGLNSVLLGGGRKPDGLVFTDKFGVIVDTKAYGKGYSKSINQADEMIRYIEDNQRRNTERNPIEWWADFDENIPQDQFYFMWISSEFVGKFQEQLDYTASQTNTRGGALNVEQLLLGADAVFKGNLDPNDLPKYMNNKEIIFGE
jgi:hypothetical protein